MNQGKWRHLDNRWRDLATAVLIAVSLACLVLGISAHASPAYRFFNVERNTHFYTTSEGERDFLLKSGPPFQYEGAAFSSPAGDEAGATAVYRFWRAASGSHFYTASTEERDTVRTIPGYAYEGVAFAAFSGGGTGRIPVYRMFNRATGAHFYSASAPERDWVARSFASYADEGIAFYAYPATGVPALAPSSFDAHRLLAQASFGATPTEVTRVRELGSTRWVEEQFAQPISAYPDSRYDHLSLDDSPTCTYNSDHTSAEYRCALKQLSLLQVQADFFTNALYAPDQLRQRVAWALSQLLVVSGMKDPDMETAHVMARYHNILFEEAFGDFGRLLHRVAISAQMGHYLDAVNNDRPDAAASRSANENFAREIMQLFTLGTVELKVDGSPILDAAGQPVPTYTQADIKALARVFTGWTYPPGGKLGGKADKPGNHHSPFEHNPRHYVGEMVTYPNGHDADAKLLFSSVTFAAGQSAQADFAQAIQTLFMHPNVGPYLALHLIRQLVTSNPSPAYVARVASAFKDNGRGQRGDMKAVLRALLLDPEARSDPRFDTQAGMLKEPVLLVTNLLRALEAKSDGIYVAKWPRRIGQHVYYSPSVFNYYPADFALPGTSLKAPQFGIHNANTVLAREGFIYDLIYNGGLSPYSKFPEAIGTKWDIEPWKVLAATPEQLVTRIDELLFGGVMEPAMRAILLEAIIAVPANKPDKRVKIALYLAANSYLYQTSR
ncbi:MAG: DUF1800 domain-containing protein [Betaproteobacteria bacterium]|nr:DUF1800 domain-containing protein [Betaproteobacteria bacterium]